MVSIRADPSSLGARDRVEVKQSVPAHRSEMTPSKCPHCSSSQPPLVEDGDLICRACGFRRVKDSRVAEYLEIEARKAKQKETAR